MAKIIKIKCNGPGRHLNEVSLEEALQKQVVYRGRKPAPGELPERLVLPCRECTAGKVIITRAMLEKIR